MTYSDSMTVERELFRSAIASFPSGVTIVTTTDADGRWWGFTATSFCSVSADPSLVLVCLAQTAKCHPVFAEAQRWLIHVIQPQQAAIAMRFATRGADKFGPADFEPDENGLPRLLNVCVTLDCVEHAKLPGGDHTILLARVHATRIGDGNPAIYFRRQFHTLPLRKEAND